MLSYRGKGDIDMGFEFTNLQKKANRKLALTKVKYRNMWNGEGELGYTSCGRNCYEINVAQDAPSEEVKAVVLIHEVGHIYYGHNDVDYKKEFKTIEGLCYSLGYTPIDLEFYGGYMHFLNIAMDFEVNTKLLTQQNRKVMADMGIGICVPQMMEIPFKNSFRDYYVPLLEHITPEFRKQARALQKALESLQDLAKSVSGFDSSLTEGEDGLDEESMYVIGGEEYNEGDVKAKAKNVVLLSDVDEETKSFSRTGKSSAKKALLELSTDEKISSFLKKLIRHTHTRQSDTMRLYNRKTRRNVPNVLYSCHRLKHETDKKKLAIIVDVSGSMSLGKISKVLRTLQTMLSSLNKDSRVITWTTEFEEEFPLTAIPELINVCGGTDMAKALEYVKDKGYSDVVMYSDFDTDIKDLTKVTNEMTANVHAIVVNDWGVGESLTNYLKLCASSLIIDKKDLEEND